MQESSLEPPKIYGDKIISNKHVFISFYKSGYSFRKCSCNRELIPECKILSNLDLFYVNRGLECQGGNCQIITEFLF